MLLRCLGLSYLFSGFYISCNQIDQNQAVRKWLSARVGLDMINAGQHLLSLPPRKMGGIQRLFVNNSWYFFTYEFPNDHTIDIINPPGGSPCEISQGLPLPFTKTNKPPISQKWPFAKKKCRGLPLSARKGQGFWYLTPQFSTGRTQDTSSL